VAKLIMWNLMTLDGFVEGPGRDISWHHDVWGSELEQLSIEQLNNCGALLFGRVTYELMANYWPTATAEAGEIADIMNRIPKFVFSRTLTRSDWNNVTFFSGDVAKIVTNLKRETEKDIYLFGSADLAANLIPHGVFDEIRIGLSPHILGSGTPLFKPGDRRQRLKLLEARPFSTGITILRYQPTA
jgi:dihydrofolate reductase